MGQFDVQASVIWNVSTMHNDEIIKSDLDLWGEYALLVL